MRLSDRLFIFIAACLALLVLTFVDAAVRVRLAEPALEARATLVRQLELTDLSLFTEARYTRHLSQSDIHTAFQDHPNSFDHFPSGSLVLPPSHLRVP